MTIRRVVRVRYWRGIWDGLSVDAASAAAGVSKRWGWDQVGKVGGVVPRHLLVPESGRYLSPMERATIQACLAAGLSVRRIAAELGRSPSTISREVRRMPRWWRRYDAATAQLDAERRRARPKPTKLAGSPQLRQAVHEGLGRKWSPQQISCRLKEQYPGRTEMHISHEAIYHALYVQSRGGLKREVAAALRTGRAVRKPRAQRAAERRSPGKITGMVMISQRPAEVADRAVPGHWEGDLIVGKDGVSQIGTLVERATRYTLLVHLPAGKDAATVAAALAATIRTLPAHLVRSLTWDQGTEMARHHQFTIDTGVQVYFCDPQSPWQRGSNENTNGLLRQYFPKGTDLSVHTSEHLGFVAAELNGRPRKTLGWRTPAEALQSLLSNPQQAGVATTP